MSEMQLQGAISNKKMICAILLVSITFKSEITQKMSCVKQMQECFHLNLDSELLLEREYSQKVNHVLMCTGSFESEIRRKR